MKVLVIWENPTEEEIAKRCANVAPNVLGTVANSIVAQMNVHRVPITARALSYKDVVDPLMMKEEIDGYVQALERAVFVDGGRI